MTLSLQNILKTRDIKVIVENKLIKKMFETICHLEVVIKKTSKKKEPIPLLKSFVTFNMLFADCPVSTKH